MLSRSFPQTLGSCFVVDSSTAGFSSVAIMSRHRMRSSGWPHQTRARKYRLRCSAHFASRERMMLLHVLQRFMPAKGFVVRVLTSQRQQRSISADLVCKLVSNLAHESNHHSQPNLLVKMQQHPQHRNQLHLMLLLLRLQKLQQHVLQVHVIDGVIGTTSSRSAIARPPRSRRGNACS
jgi:hypothetical protein